MTAPIRVAQWSTGAVGREAMLGILDAPGLELVGAKVHREESAGQDLGTLLGRAPIGVVTHHRLADFLGTAPDVVVYAPRTPQLDEVTGLLAAGIDVVTTAFAFHPARMDAAAREALHAAALSGGSTLHGSGLNPGNFSAAVPLALSGLVRELRRITLTERADWSVYESTAITFDAMRFGSPPEQVTESASDSLAFTSDLFRQQVWLLGDSLGADLDEVVTTHEVATTPERIEVFDRVIEPGTVNAQRWRWTGRRAGEDVIEIDCQWTVGPTSATWPPVEHGWTLRLEGDPSVQAHLITLASFSEPRSLADHVRAASVATALQVVNAIPAVWAAAAGFATAADLPTVRSLQGFRRPTPS